MGISACLLGLKVRYDGGHKRDGRLLRALGRLFEWVPVCPEVELGLGLPRETLRLEGSEKAPHLVFTDTRGDLTDRMSAWSRRRLRQLVALDLCGYVLKSRSPSCGLRRVPLHRPGARGAPARRGVGLFARALRDRFPLLPLEEEDRLRDRESRDRFLERVLEYRRLRDGAAAGAGRSPRPRGRA